MVFLHWWQLLHERACGFMVSGKLYVMEVASRVIETYRHFVQQNELLPFPNV